jgi:hypothetical protein
MLQQKYRIKPGRISTPPIIHYTYICFDGILYLQFYTLKIEALGTSEAMVVGYRAKLRHVSNAVL